VRPMGKSIESGIEKSTRIVVVPKTGDYRRQPGFRRDMFHAPAGKSRS
jgi:hypothetical protein